MLLGVIADDFTGATDIAGFLVENGMRTVQLNGVSGNEMQVDTDAVVISLKSRAPCPAEQAVKASLDALGLLKAQGCQQFYFKYCSTFDSTEQGNIGPVTDALLEALGESFTIICPALPVNGRTVFNGYLFVHGEPLAESGMRDHPVTPMTDSSVVRLMNRQAQGECGLVNCQLIEQGGDALGAKFADLKQEGKRYAVVDAINSAHLATLGQAVKSFKLVTGGSGLASAIACNLVDKLTHQSEAKSAGLPEQAPSIVLSGSCSPMTNKQVASYQALAPRFKVDVGNCLRDEHYVLEVLDWITGQPESRYAPMVYATAEAEEIKAIQAHYGAAVSSQAVERLFSELAYQLRKSGVRNFIVAGGETAGAVTQGLGVTAFHIGGQIAPGVPWVKSIDGALSLALKSGNFGDEQFFSKAQDFYL